MSWKCKAQENLYLAIRSIAISEDCLQDRIKNAMISNLHYLIRPHFPSDELWSKFNEIITFIQENDQLKKSDCVFIIEGIISLHERCYDE
jgi:hypothetical protein